MNASPAIPWIFSRMAACLPPPPPSSVVEWAEQNVQLVGSARSPTYRADITPWTRELVEWANKPGVRVTFVKPVQSGGSAVGEVALLYWLAHFSAGDLQYNWQNDTVSDDRWRKHMEKKMRACAPVMARVPADRFMWTKGLVIFPHCNFIMQGIYTDRSVASDTIRGQVNEELHDAEGWLPGRLRQAYARTRNHWNRIIYNISNASHVGDQLHEAFKQGTQQHWMVRCPGCQQFHRMRARWEDSRPDLGGLRYDITACRDDTGEVNYSKLLPTIRYQMPCGYIVHEDVSERRALSLSGQYSEPTNAGASPLERSYTMESVSLDYIPWVDLIRDKHLALRARRLGDPGPWLVYLRESECQFIGIEDRRPEAVPIVLSARKKDRDGLSNREFRFAQLDYQEGQKVLNETPHWWLLIMDFDPVGNSLVVFESKVDNEGDALDVLRRHGVRAICTSVDASWVGSDRYVYSFCLRNGFNAIKIHGAKGSSERTFQHADNVRRPWSEPEPLWPRAPGQQGPTKQNEMEEPEFWNISLSGALDSLAHRRARKDVIFEIPSDVSSDFREHFLPWSLEEYRVPMTNQLNLRWRKASERAPDHQYINAACLSLWADMAGIGQEDIAPPETNQPPEKSEG